MTPPSASRSPNLQRATVTPSVSRSQIASSNRTANAFLGRRPSWLTAQKSSANPAPAEPQAAPKIANVLPSLPEASSPPAPEQIPPCQVELSQRSDSSLLSPAPTDKASPSNNDKGDSPIPARRSLPGLANEADVNTAATPQQRTQDENGNASVPGPGIAAAGEPTQPDSTASSEGVPAREGQAMAPVAPPASLPPLSPSSSNTSIPPATTGPEAGAAGAAASAPPPTSYAITGQARFALIDPAEGIGAAPRPATAQSDRTMNMQAAPNTTASATSAPIAAQTPVPSSTPSSTSALIPLPVSALLPTLLPAPAPASAPIAVVDLESSSGTSTSASHMPASLLPATAGHSPYYSRLAAANRKPSPLFRYADYIGYITENIALLNSEAMLSSDTEAPRLSIIIEACQLEDGFFILVHQLYCLWSVDRLTCYRHLKPMKTDAIDMSFKVIESIFKRNDLLRPSLRVWLANFPRSFASMMTEPSPYTRVLPEVAAFLTCLPMHWDSLRLNVTQRGYPILMDELVSQLFCLSPILQTIIFTSTRRQLGLVGGEYGAKSERLFRTDQRAHNPEGSMFVGLPCDQFSSLEQVNAQLIAAYRKLVALSRAQPASWSQAHNTQIQAGQGQTQGQPQASWQQQPAPNQQSLEAMFFQPMQQPQAMQNGTRPTSQHAHHVRQGQHAPQGYQQIIHPAPGPAASPVSLSVFAEQMAQQQIMPNQQQAMQAIPAQVRLTAGQDKPSPLQTAEALHAAQMQQMQEMQQKVQQQLQQLGQTPQTAASPQQISQLQYAYQQQIASLQHQMQRIDKAFQAYKTQLLQIQITTPGQGQPASLGDAHAHMVPTQQPQSPPSPYQQQHQWPPLQQPANHQQAQQSWLQQQQQQQQQQHIQSVNVRSHPMHHQAQQQMHQQMHMQRQQGQQRPVILPSQAIDQLGQQPQAMQSAGGMHAMRHMTPVQSSLRSPVPSPIQSPSPHQQNRPPDAHRRPSAAASFVADIMHGIQQPAYSSGAPLPRGAQQPRAPQQQHQHQQRPTDQTSAQAQQQSNRANQTLRASPQGAQVERQAAAKAKPSTAQSLFPPKGTVIPLGEYPHDPSDRRAVAMSLAQARCRSPSRVIVDADTQQPVGSELAATRFYQFVQRLALGPTPTPARLYTYHLDFFVPQEEYALRATRAIPAGERLPVERHFDGSLQYRLRCCKGSAPGVAATESDWVTMKTSWPANIFMKLNGHTVTARRKTHNGRDMPANITHLVRPGVNALQVVISAPPQAPADAKLYLMGVDVVETASHQRVRSQIEQHSVQDASVTVNEIIGRLQRSAPDNDDFALLQEDLSVDLADPFSARIFNTPVRGAQCQHIECFDLDNWLDTRPAKPPPACPHLAGCRCPKTPEPTLPDKWRCPICSRDARPASLRIDQFLVNVRRTLADTGKLGRVKSILVAKDGTWKPVVEDDDDDGGEDDGDDSTGQASGSGRTGPSVHDKGKRRAADSPRGEPAHKAARVASGSGPAPAASSRRLSQAVEVIELDSD